MKPIFLIGFMGSGKTTLGRALQAETGLRLIDLDEFIEQQQGASIRELFNSHGEAHFRRLEHSALAQVASMNNVIIACGGGTPCFFNNMDLMNRAGTAVFLDASLERLHERLVIAREKRPLIASMTDEQLRSFIDEALRKRLPFYSMATETFCANRLDDAAQIAESVAQFRTRFLSHHICEEKK